jgi:hypothetical protein
MPLRVAAFATDGVEHFLKGTIKTDTQDFLGKIEGWLHCPRHEKY